MKLISVKKSTRDRKKWMAEFCECKGESCCKKEQRKVVHFGQENADDYTIGATDQQRENYRARHASGKTAKPDTADALSYYILWNSKSRTKNIKDYKKKFNL